MMGQYNSVMITLTLNISRLTAIKTKIGHPFSRGYLYYECMFNIFTNVDGHLQKI